MSRALIIAGVLLASGCSVGERPVVTDEGIDDGGAAAATVGGGELRAGTSATTGDAADGSGVVDDDALGDPATLGDAPPVIVTATGVVLPVLAPTPTGYLVSSPCGNDLDLAWGQPLGPVDIVLDPGHGGDEQGALGPASETEAEVNLDVARRAATLLDRQGFAVALTRTADYRITIPNRVAIAERLQASVLVSIHHNSPSPEIAENREDPGTEVYTQVASEESNRLGGLLYDETIEALSVFDAEWASRTDAGVLKVLNDAGEDAYGIVRRPEMPAALVEMAYLSNPTEAVVIGTDEYRQAAAQAVADGVVRFLETPDAGSGFIDEPRLFNPSAETGGSDGCIDPPLD